VLAVPVERHHGGGNVYALVDTERKDALHHPGDARTCAAAVLAEAGRRRATARQREAARQLSNPSPQGCRPGASRPLGRPMRPGPAPEAHRPLTPTCGRHRNELSNGLARRAVNGNREGDT
jgi:hypothetical protein